MGIIEYFRGRRITLHSPLRSSQVAERINAVSGSRFVPFTTGLKGGVCGNHMKLFYADWGMFSYNAEPVLVGTLEDRQGGCVIQAKFRAPLWVYAFYLFWYGFLGLFALIGISLGTNGSLEPGGGVLFVMLPLLAIAPVAMHYLFARSEKSLATILQILGNEADVTRAD